MKLCVIPARGGSKRIPRKNIKEFCGQPMIAYSIQTALNSKCFDKVVVSTDDAEIAEVAKSLGAEVPFLRPVELSNDFVGTTPVIKHAIEWFAQNDQTPVDVCCLYATAPFATSKAIQTAYNKFKDTGSGYCFTATSYAFPIQRAIKLTGQNEVEMFYPDFFSFRSQDLEEAYHDAGQFYWGKAEAWTQEIPIFSKNATVHLLPRHLVQDIDTPEDWKRAELMYQVLDKLDEFA